MSSFKAALAAAAMLAGSVSAAGGYPYFHAVADAIHGNGALDGLAISSAHIGAGQSFATGTYNYTQASQLQLTNGTYVGFPTQVTTPNGLPVPFFLNLNVPGSRPYSYSKDGTATPAAPEGYWTLTFDLGGANTPGFSTPCLESTATCPQVAFDYNGQPPNGATFGTFAFCTVTDTIIGNTVQLLWREAGTAPDETQQCADVKFNVEFLD